MRKRYIYLNIVPLPNGTGLKDARAAKRKYYLMEGTRNERLTEGGDFVLSRAPLKGGINSANP
jgi:hypothetical protein